MSDIAPNVPVIDLAVVERPATQLGTRIGNVVGVDERGAPTVDFPGNPNGPAVARVALAASDALALARGWQELSVLIVFADQDLRRPIISGIVSETLAEPLMRDAEQGEVEVERQVNIEASDELVLQCGSAKIVLRRDGKICIVGKEIVSRALESHRIKGATVAIN